MVAIRNDTLRDATTHMQKDIMKRVIEVVLNIILWIITIDFIVKTFSLETENIKYYDLGGLQSITKNYNYKLQYALQNTAIFKILFFYFNLFYFSKYFFIKKYLKYFSLITMSTFILLALEWLMLSYTCEELCFKNYRNTGVCLYIFFAATSLIYSFILQWNKDQKLKNTLKQQNINAELKLLRSQLNPHFLFNNLNNLLYIAKKNKQNDVFNGIKQLSELLRFMLYDNSRDKITLKKEIEFIKNFIALNELRFDREDKITIDFKVLGNIENLKITPSLLIPFIENAFKHGIDIYENSFVLIKLEVKNNIIFFEVKNSIEKDKVVPIENSGVGLENVKKRLTILYENKHELKIKKLEKAFIINLQLEV